MAFMQLHYTQLAACFLWAGFLTACGGDDGHPERPPASATKIAIDFNTQASGWTAKFADYPVGEEVFYELSSAVETLPASLGNNKKGIKISGNNHSDDLFMFITRKFTGFEPNTRYDIEFELGIGTNVHSNCSGIGGSPGNSVYVKAGASKVEPQPVDDGTGFYLLNIDKNNQAAGGADVMLLGDIANGLECDDADTSFKKKTLKSEPGKFTTYSDANGALWVVFGTDSGYEGTTSIYFVDARVTFVKR
jgi:hypothetical protein